MMSDANGEWCTGAHIGNAPAHQTDKGSLKALAFNALVLTSSPDVAQTVTAKVGAVGARGATGASGASGADDYCHAVRKRLTALAETSVADTAHIQKLENADLLACVGLEVSQLAAYVSMLADTADRYAGRVPAGHTVAMHCEQCGPVWIHPNIAEVLPVFGGWPRALGCPWCFVRKTGGYIPRPPVVCKGCAHFIQDTINPDTGMAECGAGKGTHHPMAQHVCGDHSTRSLHEKT